MVSPGLSSVPAKSEPIITEWAPAAIALVRSPENLMPPSAMTGTPCSAAARDDPGGADAPRSDPHLDGIRAALDQRQGPLFGGHVAHHQLDLGEALAQHRRGV